MESASRRAAWFAFCAIAVALLWQWATVAANYGGNWTALFETGSRTPLPAALGGEHIYRFPDSSGFDGQAYHLIAHDPFLRDAKIRAAIDDPALRYRRILVPGVVWLLAFGQSGAIDALYIAVCLGFIALGVWWSARLCVRFGMAAACGLAFLLAPAVLVTVDRMVVDAALAALTVAFLLYEERGGWRLGLVLCAAALTRETGFLLVIAYCVWLAVRRQWRDTLRFAWAAAPAVAWYLFVAAQTTLQPYPERFTPMASIVQGLIHPQAYPAGTPLIAAVQAADWLALAAAVAAFAMSICLATVLRRLEPDSIAALLFALMGIFSQRPDQWRQVFDFGRVYTPVLLILAAQGLRKRQTYWMAPWLLMLPRVTMQFAPQVEGIARALGK